ncbi:MAG: hypothetical protein ACKPGB_11525, partial [Dolichospermum sp.]
DAVDKGNMLSHMLREITTRDCSVDGAASDVITVDAMCYAYLQDAMRAFAVVTASLLKIHAANGMLSYAQYLQKLLDNLNMTAICWADTRDMLADGAATDPAPTVTQGVERQI